MIEEEEMLNMIMKKAIIPKRGQGIPCMRIMQLLPNLNIFLFMFSLVLPLWIHMIVGW